VRECVGFNIPPDAVYVILGTAFPSNARTHNNGTVSLTFTEKPNMKQKKTEKQPKPKTAHVTVMAVLIIFPVILQTVGNLKMLSIGEQGARGGGDRQRQTVELFLYG